jgi:hypothetical protein
MTKKQTDPIRTRLAVEDRYKFEQICRAEGKTETEVARKALLQFIDSYDKKAEDSSRDRLAEILVEMEKERRKDTERLAKLAARTLIDVGTIQQVFYKRASEKDRDDLWQEARKNALERLRKKRKGGDPEATEIVNDAVSS